MRTSKAQQFLAVARQAFGRSADWIEFTEAIYRAGGPFSQLFPTQRQRKAFSRTQEAREIETMTAKLLEPGGIAAGQLVLRMPSSMAEALQREAEAAGVGLLALCIAKLSAPLSQSVTFI
jgi:hypothetical protein